MNMNESIRMKVMKYREEQGLSQSELGNLIGISRSHMNKLENGTLQISLVYLKQIADVLKLPMDVFFEEIETKRSIIAFDFEGVNQGITELAHDYLAEGENYFTVDYKTLLVTEEKLAKWKECAHAGSIIIGSVACRYLLFSDSKPHPKKPGYLRTKYGFINIDHAGWDVCNPRFDSTDELIEWFASNIENPLIDVIPSSAVKKLLPGQEFI